jgi:hypothetical protein
MDTDDCITWPGPFDADGYGRVYRNGTYVGVHRVVWEAAHGPIPSSTLVLHYCDNPPCYRLDHLRAGTHAENMSDRKLAGHYRGVRGERNGHSKLTEADVLEIRALYDDPHWTQQRIADRFDITQPQVSDLVRRKLWTHI